MTENVKSRAKETHDDGLPSSYRPQYEIVADKIVAFISREGLQPSARLPTEQSLGVQLGASRSIVREAVKYLTATGLVVARKGVGISVAGGSPQGIRSVINLSMSVDPEQIQSLFDFRRMQETLTTQMAADQITLAELRELEAIVADNRSHAVAGALEAFLLSDDAFHLAIARATHNLFLVETITAILDLQRWAVKVMTGSAPGSLLVAVEQHETILAAIKHGQGNLAAQAAQTHVETVVQAYRQEVRRRLLTAEKFD